MPDGLNRIDSQSSTSTSNFCPRTPAAPVEPMVIAREEYDRAAAALEATQELVGLQDGGPAYAAASAALSVASRRLMDAPTTTPAGLLMKLDFIEDLEDLECGYLWQDAVKAMRRDLRAALGISISATSCALKLAGASQRVEMRPAQLVRKVIKALRPLLVPDRIMDFGYVEGLGEIHAYRALVPIFGSFSVAEAVLAIDILHAARLSKSDVEYGALYEAGGVLEAFVATARASAPDCVSELARHLTIYEDGEPRISEVLRPLAAKSLLDGVNDLRRNDFVLGERFGSAGDGESPISWCYRAAKGSGRMEWWWPSVKVGREKAN